MGNIMKEEQQGDNYLESFVWINAGRFDILLSWEGRYVELPALSLYSDVSLTSYHIQRF
jgi:hypothetical protein